MTQKEKVLVGFTTCPSQEVAQRVARTLVEEQLAACVNCLPGVTSIYKWKGKVETDAEVLLMIKTTENRAEALKTRLIQLHPYELPEFIALPVCAGAENYLEWVRDSVK